jgi:hypothetical protein
MKLRKLCTVILLARSARAFLQLRPPSRHGASSVFRLPFASDGGAVEAPTILPAPVRLEADDQPIEWRIPQTQQPPSSVLSQHANRKLVLSPLQQQPAADADRPTTTRRTDFWHGRQKALHKWIRRPGVQFRLRLGLLVSTAFTVASVWLPRRTPLATTALHWVSHRGFQGVAALGRSVAYIWALLVAYPRLLDRRAAEQRRQKREREREGRRQHQSRLWEEVVRLRHELSALDAEIRSFRREIIALQAYAKGGNDDHNASDVVQAAIAAEMTHLAQLRSDTQAALVAARQAWADLRAQSPPNEMM